MGRSARLRKSRQLNRAIEAMLGDCNDDDGYADLLMAALKQYPFPTSDGRPYPIGGWAEMAAEAIAIRKRESATEWQLAMLLLFDGLLAVSKKDWFMDFVPDAAISKIREAGSRLNDIGGTDEMLRSLTIWVPGKMQTLVERYWNNIGRWKA